MFRSLRITGFRDIERLNVERLARVNLFVGGNNSGKTSLLEAVEILLGRGDVHSLVAGSLRRDETMDVHQDGRKAVAVRHLFHGHELEVRRTVVIQGDQGDELSVRIQVAPQSVMDLAIQDEARGPDLRVLAIAEGRERHSTHFLTSEGNLTYTPALRLRDSRTREIKGGFNFITTAGAGLGQLLQLWDEVVLSPDEALVLDALRIIEPRIARIAAVDREVSSGAFMSLMHGSRARTPLGSMGDGIRRLLALAIYLVRSAGGTLLIDEIDTGLHHSVMVQMWKLVVETAARLDVQVFATTHSMDCVAALATLSEDEPALKPAVLLHRVEKHREATVIYSADELAEAASAGIEMRGVRG